MLHYCRYKRDYYINDDEANHHKIHSPINATPKITPTKYHHQTIPAHFNDSNEEIIKANNKKTYEEMTVSMLIEDNEMPAKYTRHDQDFSLPISEDSETTRIYTPSTQEMKLIAPHAERISTTKGIPVTAIKIDDSYIVTKDDNNNNFKVNFILYSITFIINLFLFIFYFLREK